jgi:hypothetical protein
LALNARSRSSNPSISPFFQFSPVSLSLSSLQWLRGLQMITSHAQITVIQSILVHFKRPSDIVLSLCHRLQVKRSIAAE